MQDEKRNDSDPFGSVAGSIANLRLTQWACEIYGMQTVLVRMASIRRLVLAVLACFGFVQGAWAQSPQGRQLDDAQIAFVRALVLLYETKTIEDISIADIESTLRVKLVRIAGDGSLAVYEVHGVPGGRPPGTPGDSDAWLTIHPSRKGLYSVRIAINFLSPPCFDVEQLLAILDLRLTRFSTPGGLVTYSTKLPSQKHSAVPKMFGISGFGNCFDSIGLSYWYLEK